MAAAKLDVSIQESVDKANSALQSVTKADVGLDNVDNTSDADKPISASTETALNKKIDAAELDSSTAALVSSSSTDTATALNELFLPQAEQTELVAGSGIQLTSSTGQLVISTANNGGGDVQTVMHETTPNIARPTAASVTWIGTATPINMTKNDIWTNPNTGVHNLATLPNSNMLVNGTFDTDATDWGVENSIVARVTNAKRSGTGALSVTANGSGAAKTTSGIIPVSTDIFCGLRVFARAESGNLNLTCKLLFLDSAYGWVGFGETDGHVTATASGWNIMHASTKVPANGAFIFASIETASPVAANTVFYIDDVLLYNASA